MVRETRQDIVHKPTLLLSIIRIPVVVVWGNFSMRKGVKKSRYHNTTSTSIYIPVPGTWYSSNSDCNDINTGTHVQTAVIDAESKQWSFILYNCRLEEPVWGYGYNAAVSALLPLLQLCRLPR